MEELNIIFDKESPQQKNTNINVKADIMTEKEVLYKFIIGREGTWNTIKDFSYEDSIEWEPKEDGRYIIMVQAKFKNTKKPFDSITKFDYVIGDKEEGLIKNVYLNKDELKVGEKLEVFVETTKFPLMYRYWIKEDSNWEIIRDYCTENNVSFTVKKPGIKEILVECKNLNSTNNSDDSFISSYKVNDIDIVEIVDFKCLTRELICDKELVFKVESVFSEGRNILYKFIKINCKGECECVQNYSTNNIVSYKEVESGEYKLLCLVKDMYSQREFDDRGLIKFEVKPYKDIVIRNFTTNLNSPQMCQTPIELKANVEGGRELLYRFIINGKQKYDSGYIRSDSYTWKPDFPGKYRLEALVKDRSSEEEYEDKTSIDFSIEEYSKEPIEIEKVILDKGNRVLKGEPVEIRVVSNGEKNVRYSFIIKKDKREIEKIDYGTCNWVDFIPREVGTYELEVLAKHRLSNRQFDSHSISYIESYDYIPGKIDYVLYPAKENYIVGDEILIKVITQNTKENLIRYDLTINNQKVEGTDYIKGTDFRYIPKCSGFYKIEIFCKNKQSKKMFDSKKEIKVFVREAMPITNTKIKTNKIDVKCNETMTFSVDSKGGNAVLYEFYLMNNGEWKLMQEYSRKKYYTFMPFVTGEYEILALSKSSYSKCAYEDYDIIKFKV